MSVVNNEVMLQSEQVLEEHALKYDEKESFCSFVLSRTMFQEQYMLVDISIRDGRGSRR